MFKVERIVMSRKRRMTLKNLGNQFQIIPGVAQVLQPSGIWLTQPSILVRRIITLGVSRITNKDSYLKRLTTSRVSLTTKQNLNVDSDLGSPYVQTQVI